jgi:uncharacterized damage-inducible protein DinB/uncharacterized membrane protein
MTSSIPLILLVHIAAAVVGLLSGFLTMAFRKGSSLHRAAGTVFFASMLIMTASAGYAAVFERPNTLNAIVAHLTFYLVATGWWAARRADGATGRFDIAALLFVAAVGVVGLISGVEAVRSPTGTKDGMPGAAYLVFGTIALLCAMTDIRMLRRGNLSGARRIARHLWRMCLALLIATASFYPGQAKLFSPESRTGFLFVPHVLLIASMIFWMVRVRLRQRVPQRATSKGDEMKATVKAVAAMLICLLAPAAVIMADDNPFTAHGKHLYGGASKILLRAAEDMPEEHYSYKPTEAVRTYGQIVGHVVDSQYTFCSAVFGEKNPGLNIEKTKTSKADLIAALSDAVAYCDKVYAGLTDASAAKTVKMMHDMPRLGVLTVNIVHSIEHYGNMVTYMRMKNIVPPTSDPEFMKQLSK